MICAEKLAVKRPFNLAHKLKITENVLKVNGTRETEMEVLLCKNIKKNLETGGYERDRSVRSEKKLKKNKTTTTETKKKLQREENREQVQISVKSVGWRNVADDNRDRSELFYPQ